MRPTCPPRTWLAVFALLAACGRADPEAAKAPAPPAAAALADGSLPEGTVKLAILYSNNVDGDTEPCG